MTSQRAELTKEDKQAHRFYAHVVKDKAVEDLPVFIRGNVDQKGEVIPGASFLAQRWCHRG